MRAPSARTCCSAATLTSAWRRTSCWDWKLPSCGRCILDRECASIITMIWRWLICSSVGLGVALGAHVTGEVELSNSRDVAVRRHKDYGGVVLWLEPVDRPAPALTP